MTACHCATMFKVTDSFLKNEVGGIFALLHTFYEQSEERGEISFVDYCLSVNEEGKEKIVNCIRYFKRYETEPYFNLLLRFSEFFKADDVEWYNSDLIIDLRKVYLTDVPIYSETDMFEKLCECFRPSIVRFFYCLFGHETIYKQDRFSNGRSFGTPFYIKTLNMALKNPHIETMQYILQLNEEMKSNLICLPDDFVSYKSTFEKLSLMIESGWKIKPPIMKDMIKLIKNGKYYTFRLLYKHCNFNIIELESSLLDYFDNNIIYELLLREQDQIADSCYADKLHKFQYDPGTDINFSFIGMWLQSAVKMNVLNEKRAKDKYIAFMLQRIDIPFLERCKKTVNSFAMIHLMILMKKCIKYELTESVQLWLQRFAFLYENIYSRLFFKAVLLDSHYYARDLWLLCKQNEGKTGSKLLQRGMIHAIKNNNLDLLSCLVGLPTAQDTKVYRRDVVRKINK